MPAAGQRWGLFTALRSQRPSKIVKTLVVNVVLSFSLFVPIFAFLGIRSAERVVISRDKLPWLRFYDDPATTMVISWETSASSSSHVEYGMSTSLGSVETDPALTTVHHVYLAGLQPNTTYFYRVGHNDSGTPVMGSIYSFTTAPGMTAAPFTFLAMSDTQESELGINHHPLVAAGLAREAAAGARFVLHGGDVADSGNDQEEWDYFWKHAGVYSPNLPIMTAIGNHDNRPGEPLYRKYFAFRTPGEPLYYSFNYTALLHVLVLRIMYGQESDFTTEMMSFVNTDLTASAVIPFKVLVFHCPLISSGFFGINQVVMDHMRSLLATYNVTVVITGHDHHYERLILDETTHLVIGGGGGLLDPCHNVLAETQAVGSFPHYVRFHVDPARGMSYEALLPDGTVFDATYFPLP